MSSITSQFNILFHVNTETQNNDLAKKPPNEGDARKKVKVIDVSEKENIKILDDIGQTAKSKLQAIQFYEDAKMIEEGIGGTEPSNLVRFHRKFGETIFAIMRATALELAEIRQSETNKVVCSGFKKVGLKDWKFVVEFDKNKKISELFIGKFISEGSFTKVYLTINREVILIPKKRNERHGRHGRRDETGNFLHRTISNQQMLRAYQNICLLHEKYEPLNLFPTEIAEVLDSLHYTKKELMKLLPPKPKMIQAGARPVLVAPQAACVKVRFNEEPTSLHEVIKRIEILRDVSLGVALSHQIGLVHGDLKPENMLINAEGMGQFHDLGGSKYFCKQDSPEEGAKKYNEMITTPNYTQIQDISEFKRLFTQKADVHDFFDLGCEGDIFALGVSTIEALNGMSYSNGRDKMPFHEDAYHIVQYKAADGKKKKRMFVKSSLSGRKSISCIKKISPKIDAYLNKMLDGALQPKYFERLSAREYAKGLNDICIALKKMEQESQSLEGIAKLGGL